MSASEIASQLDKTAKAIKTITGTRPSLVRPPYGAANPMVYKVLKKRGEPAIMWDVDTEDWKNRNTSITTTRALSTARKGSIILVHDIHRSTVAATPGVIKALKKKGYVFVTVSELLGSPKAGKAYYGR